MNANVCNGIKVVKVTVNERRAPKMHYNTMPNGSARPDQRGFNSARAEYYETTRVYVSPTKWTLMEQMESRRAKPSVTFKRLVEAELKEAGYTGKVRYSRYAGCKMCPCSPGFVLETQLDVAHPVDVWLDVDGV